MAWLGQNIDAINRDLDLIERSTLGAHGRFLAEMMWTIRNYTREGVVTGLSTRPFQDWSMQDIMTSVTLGSCSTAKNP